MELRYIKWTLRGVTAILLFVPAALLLACLMLLGSVNFLMEGLTRLLDWIWS